MILILLIAIGSGPTLNQPVEPFGCENASAESDGNNVCKNEHQLIYNILPCSIYFLQHKIESITFEQ